jgi:ABC-type glutathione transport system ATPase component
MRLHKGLRISHMNFAFSATKKFFNNVSMHCEPGELNFLQGKNGSGKSTLFAILQGYIPSHAQLTGTFSIDEYETKVEHNQLNYSFTKHITTVVQKVDEMIAPHFSVEQNVQCANLPNYPGLYTLPSAQKMSLLQDFNIDTRMRVEQLSGGQKQIVAIVMALQKSAQLLLLDEPTAALDPKNAHMVMQCLRKLAQTLHITVLIISHDKELVQTYAPGYYFEINQDDHDLRTIEKKLF